MRRHPTVTAAVAMATAWALAGPANAQLANVLFQENFNGLTLGPSVNERGAGLNFPVSTGLTPGVSRHVFPSAFSHTGPTGWTVDNGFDNFGNVDLTNSMGTSVFDATVVAPDPPVMLFKIPSLGQVVGNVGVPNVGSATAGPDEWEGWSFASKSFWVAAAEDQERSTFNNASGTIAVVDPDEYDDGGDGGLTSGLAGRHLNSGMTTSAISVTGLPSLELEFDSSWRAEGLDDGPHPDLGHIGNNQTAIIWASFSDGGGNLVSRDFVDVWDSDNGHTSDGPTDPVPTRPASADFKGDATNEHQSHAVSVPPGATSVKFTFGMINAANDWWWAVDNLAVSDGVNAPFWTENFEGVALGSSVNEFEANVPTFTQQVGLNNDPATSPIPNAFTHVTPAGWSIDNAGIKPATIGDNNLGVFEWEGWSFAQRDFWARAQSGGAGFLKADGTFAIADSDEFDDLGRNPNNETPNPNYTRPMGTVLATPAIDLTGVAAGTLFLKFDSSWQWESGQTAVITVNFGGGAVEVLRWESDQASPFFHGDNVDETVLIPLNNPGGASNAVVRFSYVGSNNWWWAIDNVQIGTVPEPSTIGLSAVTALALASAARRQRS